MTINRETVKNLLTNLVVFLLFLNLISFGYFIAFGYTNFIWWMLAFPFFSMQFIRAKVKNVYVFCVWHVMLSAGAVLILGDYWVGAWLVLAFMVVSCIYSFVVRIFGERAMSRATGTGLVVVHTIMFIWAGMTLGNPEIIHRQLAGTSLVMLGLILVYIHMDNIDFRMRVTQITGESDNPSARRVLEANNILIAVFALILFVIGAIAMFFPIGRLIIGALNAVIDFINNTFVQPIASAIGYAANIIAENFGFFREEEYEPEYGIQEMFEEVNLLFFDTIAYIILALVLALIINFIRLFFKHFQPPKRKKAKADGQDDDIIQLAGNILSDLRDLFPRFRSRSKNAIRRVYAKKVNRHIRLGADVTKADTTDIIADKIRSLEDIDELTLMYEKVRYGG